MLNWFPILNAGTFTGQDQAAWTVTGNADYIVMGGEFTTVNSSRPAGPGPVRRGPACPRTHAGRGYRRELRCPTLSSQSAGTVRVRWQANWDQDNENLTYEVRRNGSRRSPPSHQALHVLEPAGHDVHRTAA